MIWLEIGMGDIKTHKQWFPVVPDNYLNADLLLGCDVLGQAPVTWDVRKRVIMWGNAPYIVHHVKRQRGKVERIQCAPLNAEPSTPYQTNEPAQSSKGCPLSFTVHPFSVQRAARNNPSYPSST